VAGAATKRSTLWVAVLVAALASLFLAFAENADSAIYWNSFPMMRGNNDGLLMQENFIERNYTHLPPAPSPSAENGVTCEGIAVDGSHMYVADAGHGAIVRADLDGRNVNYSFITGLQNPCGVAIDATSVYWVDHDTGTIGKANLDGGEVQREFVTHLTDPCGLAVGGGYLYWTDGREIGEETSYISRIPVGGGIRQVLYEGGGNCGVAVDATHVYWGTFEHEIGRMELDGGHPEPQFVSGVERPCGVAVAAPYLYWSTDGGRDAAIGRTEIEGSRTSVKLYYGYLGGGSCAIAVDGRDIPPPALPDPPPKPSNIVGVERPLRHSKSSASTLLTLVLPQAGALTVDVGKGLLARALPFRSWPVTVSAARKIQVKVWPAPGGRAAQAVRDKLRRQGRVSVIATVRFAIPEGTSSMNVRVPLIAHRHRHR
jgi:hypothetical protein